ncbi:hypothetical protein H5410_030239 [Solanum commersonii]|uniref:Uncharacterized protein n=1 Tax=Solanum commersonii TaxID=4109 RepID=A0A9J5YFK2_SOLCO|nr:hypothetical protein H5410_030239 [Solanum commersonii]
MIHRDEFDIAANIIVPIKNPKSSRSMADIQSEERMAHMEQELEILREELCQVDSPSADLPNQPELTQHAPTHVRTVPDLSNRVPTIPTMQQILGAHVAAPYETHVPPVYAAGALTFTTPAVKKEDVSTVTYQQRGPSYQYPNNPQIIVHNSYVPVYNTQPHYNPPRAPAYQNPPRPYVPVQAPNHQNRPAYALRPRPNPEARNARIYTSIAKPYAQLFERLRTAGVLQPVKGNLPDPIPHNLMETSDALTTRESKDMT